MKIRTDFVSNSSSSSFIVSCKNTSDIANATNIANALQDDPNPVIKFFKDYTCLTLCECETGAWIDKFGNTLYVYIPDGICILDEEIKNYFDENDNVRSDLDFLTIFKQLNWYAFNKDDQPDGENEQIVYENASIMGKVNKYSIKFTKWLYENTRKHFNDVNISSNGCDDVVDLVKISTALANGHKLYYTRYSYQGDAECYGHIYVDFYNDNRSISKRLLNAKAIDNFGFYA